MNPKKIFQILLIAFISTTLFMIGTKCTNAYATIQNTNSLDINDSQQKDKGTVTKKVVVYDEEEDSTPILIAPLLDEIELTKKQVKEKAKILETNIETAIVKLKEQPGCLRLSGNTAVVGDIHGDSGSLCCIVNTLQLKLNSKEISNVLFLGDFLDRFKTRSTDTFIKLLDFFNKNENVFILRGNHETLLAKVLSDADEEPVFKFIRTKYPKRSVNPIDRFKESLPHAAIINDDTLAVHGGIPWFKPEHSNDQNDHVDIDTCLTDFFTSSTEKKGEKAKLAVLCATWSDFSPELDAMRPNEKRGCLESCLFSFDNVTEFFAEVAKKQPGLNFKHLICGHDHFKGSFHQIINTDGVSVTTVISSPALLLKCGLTLDGCVALVQKGKYPTKLLNITLI